MRYVRGISHLYICKVRASWLGLCSASIAEGSAAKGIRGHGLAEGCDKELCEQGSCDVSGFGSTTKGGCASLQLALVWSGGVCEAGDGLGSGFLA